MELQLLACGEWRHDALLQMAFKPPWRKKGERTHRILPRAHDAHESQGLSLIESESGNGMNPSKVSPVDRWKGFGRDIVASPRYSSLLKLTRRRHAAVRMETRDRVLLSISDWVFRRVKDPLVEIDPVTVNKAILAEEQATENEPTVAGTTSPSFFGYLPPGFPKGADGAALAAGIVLLLAALGTAAILALRGNKTAAGVTHVAPGGQASNGSVTTGAGAARKDLEDDEAVTWKRAVPAVAASSLETQKTTPQKPIPLYSTALEQADLPLPPSFGTSTKDKEIDPPSSSSGDDLGVSLVNLPDNEKTDVVRNEVPLVDEVNEPVDEEVIISNGVLTGDLSAIEEEIAAELDSDASLELAESAASEVELTAAKIQKDLLESGPVGDSVVAVQPAIVPAEGLPSASKSLEDELSEVFVGEEYMLIGESESLSPGGTVPPTRKPIAAHTATADAGAPADSILLDKSAAQSPHEEPSFEKIDSASAKEGFPRDSNPFEESQADFGAEVAEERRKEDTQFIEKVLPVVSVGAGVAALGSFSGVDGALQVVGALAAASLLREFVWAGPRQQLFDEIRNIKSHKELMQFLEDKKIFPQSWSH